MKKNYFTILIKGFIVILFFLGIWSILIEPNIIKVEKISIEIKALPASFTGAKIAVLADLHSKYYGAREKKVLKILKKINPDFIFLAGDIVDWSTKNLKSCQEFWKDLDRNYHNKIFAVYGNHEHLNPRFKTFNKLLRETEIEIINNQARKIEKNEEFIYLLGVDDPHLGYDDLSKAMEEIGSDDASPKILLAHPPEIFRKVKTFNEEKIINKKIDLVLTGHTHGGQINIPFFVDFILPLNYDSHYKAGFFKENSTYLYVSRGIGNSGLPIRLNSFPEITLIKLESNNTEIKKF